MTFKPLVLSLLTAVCIHTAQAAYPLTETKPTVVHQHHQTQPNRIAITINGDPSREMAFNWYSSEALNGQVWLSTHADMREAKTIAAERTPITSHYGERDARGNFIFADIKKDDNGKENLNGYYTDREPTTADKKWLSGKEIGKLTLYPVEEYAYKAQVTDLKPNTRYYYQVGSADKKSAIGTFRTAGAAGEAFSFIHYTDTQNAFWNENVRNEAAFGADTLNQALALYPQANFVLHTGDVVEIAEVEDEWTDLFKRSEAAWLKLPLVPVAGNHDEYSLDRNAPKQLHAFNHHFNVPAAENKISGGSYYSFDYNGVHFIIANTNDNKKSDDNPEGQALGKAQLDWIKQDAAKAKAAGAQWIVLSYHKPLFSRSYHSLQDEDVQKVREAFMRLIDEADIDLVLQGHDHVLSRTKSLQFVPSSENFSNAKVEHVTEFNGENYAPYYRKPQGTVFILPSTAGTKAYDDIFSKPLAHIKKVRPKLRWLTQENLDYWNSLFALGSQPQKAPEFAHSHSNSRDSSQQNFAVYRIENNRLHVELYQVVGDIHQGEVRKVRLVDEFGIEK